MMCLLSNVYTTALWKCHCDLVILLSILMCPYDPTVSVCERVFGLLSYRKMKIVLPVNSGQSQLVALQPKEGAVAQPLPRPVVA